MSPTNCCIHHLRPRVFGRIRCPATRGSYCFLYLYDRRRDVFFFSNVDTVKKSITLSAERHSVTQTTSTTTTTCPTPFSGVIYARFRGVCWKTAREQWARRIRPERGSRQWGPQGLQSRIDTGRTLIRRAFRDTIMSTATIGSCSARVRLSYSHGQCWDLSR